MAEDTRVVTLPTGRGLAWAEQGAPGGRPVLSLHGAPGSRLSRYADAKQLRAAGIRQLTYDRPGYGLSDPSPGRTVADAVPDVEAVLTAAGVSRAAVIGGSGGGPHALAVAALLPERVTVVHCRVGVAPFDAPDLEFFAGMDPHNERRFRAAASGRSAALEVLGRDLEEMRTRTSGDPANLMGDMDVPDADRAVLRRLGSQIAATVTESARQGALGVADDFVALTCPWGFDLGRVQVPVVLSYAQNDVNVPAGHGRWLAEHIRTAEVRVDEAAGHLATPEAEFALLLDAASAMRP